MRVIHACAYETHHQQASVYVSVLHFPAMHPFSVLLQPCIQFGMLRCLLPAQLDVNRNNRKILLKHPRTQCQQMPDALNEDPQPSRSTHIDCLSSMACQSLSHIQCICSIAPQPIQQSSCHVADNDKQGKIHMITATMVHLLYVQDRSKAQTTNNNCKH